MRIVTLCIVAAALCAACAEPRTSEMGAGPAATVVCRDGAYVSSTGNCGNHGGVERAMGTPDSTK